MTSVVIRSTVFRSAHPSSSDSLWLSSGESVEDKIKKLGVELYKYREHIQKTRSGPVQQALKARAMRLLKHKKMTLSRNKLNGTIPVSLTGLPNLINLFLKLYFRSQNTSYSSKPKTGIIAGVVAGVTVVLFGILVFLFCRDKHKGYKRDVFVDVAAVPPQIGLIVVLLRTSTSEPE
uniref:Uncharacterized protein n=1 Tax=Brassica oleracea var. oleracea TaxID=109376 RepID=A0A0D3EEC8_BRAOL